MQYQTGKPDIFQDWRSIIRGRCLRICGAVLAVISLLPPVVSAGGGPETTLVVVNANSPLSKRIANEYIALRGISDTHLLWLQDVPSMDVIPVEDFRRRIWLPIRDYLVRHDLKEEIDIIAYSADFPYAVDFSADLKGWKVSRSKYLGRVGSLTAMTYFARRVELADPGYVGRNYYFREYATKRAKAPAHTPTAVQRLDVKEARRLEKAAEKSLHRKPELASRDFQTLVDNAPHNPRNWLNLARSQAATGSRDQALMSLENAVDQGWINSVQVQADRYFDVLKSDAHFQSLIERMENAVGPFQLTHGFSHDYVWSNPDLAYWKAGDELDRYYLSTMLAYTGVRGNSYPEIMAYLDSAADSDGTHPDGTFYLMENPNVRSKTRQGLFPATLGELTKRGHRGQVLFKRDKGQDGVLPHGKDDVAGVVAGFNRYDWSKTGSRMLPGTIAESLTSYGGDFDRRVQTKLTEFLRHGAAGSSGAVAEPYAFQAKFPLPLIHAWYADGCSLAEAFYQSVQMPYQLIVVGDPLARPYATLEDISLVAPAPSSPWAGEQMLEVKVGHGSGVVSKRLEVWVDGQKLSESPPGKPIALDTRQLEDGSHLLRIVSVGNSAIETRSSVVIPIQIRNTRRHIDIKAPDGTVDVGSSVRIQGSAPGARSVELFRGYRSLGSANLDGSTWQVEMSADALGIGPVEVTAVARFDTGPDVRSQALRLNVGAPPGLAPVRDKAPSIEGFRAQVRDHRGDDHELILNTLGGRLRDLVRQKIKPASLRLEGYFHVEADGFYQLGIRSTGRLRVAVNDAGIIEKQMPKNQGELFVPLSLQSGWHRLELEADLDTRPYLKIVLAGDRVPILLEGFSDPRG